MFPKKTSTTFLAVLFAAAAWAQSPEKMSYQAVIRDAASNLVTNHPVGMQISILSRSAIGIPVYVETQTPVSNANGLVTLEIGGGTPVSGNFATINWGSGTYFIQTEIDPAGTTNYSITSTSQLLSVPYALHAKKAGMMFRMLHRGDLALTMTPSRGPYVEGNSTDIGDINEFSSLLLEWRMDNRPDVFQQLILLADYDKRIILGTIPEPDNYPRRYSTIVADNFGVIQSVGVSLQGTRLWLSANSESNPRITLIRIYGIE